MTIPPPIVDLDWVITRRRTLVLCDVRWYLDGRSGQAAYAAGHLPGAVFVDLDRWLAAAPSPAAGRHPLPAPDVFAAGMRNAGIDDHTLVVAYDDAGGATAARLVWMLRASGGPAALLDGGLGAWTAPLSRVRPVVTPGTFVLTSWPGELLADADDVAAARSDDRVVVDARAPDRFHGIVEPVDPRAGHIPGAVNVPFAGNLDAATGRFLGRRDLRRRFARAGVDDHADTIVYCGSGVTACHTLLAMERAGLPAARLYPGSWSQWSADPTRPVEV
ncbi:MAG: sulfurtransferase [Actinobacteria bacterium]|nr:sulfurtransferase [Actinomycetota bacterium]